MAGHGIHYDFVRSPFTETCLESWDVITVKPVLMTICELRPPGD